tara:strand:- start:28648 stop:29265 length:618 start_codon:yes stop_codon:yes gene_type:complete
MEYYIYNVPLFVVEETSEDIDLPLFCSEVEEILPPRVFRNIDVIYVGNFKELRGRNAAFTNGAVYMSANEPTNFDMIENLVHEVAHSLETEYGWDIYTDDLLDEFKSKRTKLYHILTAHDYHINPSLYGFTEYNEKFDDFLANTVGYPTLLNLTMGLFVSPYGATSLQEYFANGFEKYFLDNPRTVNDISPILYRKIEDILDEQA